MLHVSSEVDVHLGGASQVLHAGLTSRPNRRDDLCSALTTASVRPRSAVQEACEPRMAIVWEEAYSLVAARNRKISWSRAAVELNGFSDRIHRPTKGPFGKAGLPPTS